MANKITQHDNTKITTGTNTYLDTKEISVDLGGAGIVKLPVLLGKVDSSVLPLEYGVCTYDGMYFIDYSDTDEIVLRCAKPDFSATLDLTFNLEEGFVGIDGDFFPDEDAEYNLGSDDNHWKELFLSGDINHSGDLQFNADRFIFGNPITLDNTTLLGSPVTGTLEFSGNKLYVTNKSLQKVLDRTSDVKLTTTTVSDTTTETTVFTASVPANSWVAGNILKMKMFGEITNTAMGNDVTITIKVGGAEIASIVSDGRKLANNAWIIDGTCIVRTVGASGEMAWTLTGKIDGQDRDFTTGVTAINTTGALDITVTAEWDTANAGNILLCTGGFMEYKN